MTDVVLDSNILADLIAQYYVDEVQRRGYFECEGLLNKELVRLLNRILRWHLLDEDEEFFPGLVVASSFAFVEIARKFDEIVKGRFSIAQFAAFIDQPPEWFFISAIDRALLPHLCDLPSAVKLPSGDVKPIELADALHVATAISRGSSCLLAVTDARIKAIEIVKGRLI